MGGWADGQMGGWIGKCAGGWDVQGGPGAHVTSVWVSLQDGAAWGESGRIWTI
eukprot:CAMPEP_0119305576 /NCGR_PEP_ID=MMETSP1333-20130426/6544_1 /TAXON_ID=418940 /ORGANISM="Scyphosphaera apsteinii, Strain RCC1455" /LENGTH=52 /DNA_ID=CAMNT_0007308701 /DNA_START=201 /DNA_END=359 /DNA_ORIENTATION=-